MKKQFGDCFKDLEKYRKIVPTIKDKFNFLISEYNFTFRCDLGVYGAYIYYMRKEFTLLLTYGAPEFIFEAGIRFPSSTKSYVLGKVLETKLYHWDSACISKIDRNDRLQYNMEMIYIFLRNNIDILLAKSEETAQKLETEE